MTDEKNVTKISKEDKEFIRVLMELSPEKKILIKGIVIGFDLQENIATATLAR